MVVARLLFYLSAFDLERLQCSVGAISQPQALVEHILGARRIVEKQLSVVASEF